MAVERIEEYGDVLKIILKSTIQFPIGYFYTDNNQIAKQLVESYSWYLHKVKNNIYVEAHKGQKKIRFHKEYVYLLLNYYTDYIDHINGLGIDNREVNLNIVTNSYNRRNIQSLGYRFATRHCFQPRYNLDGKHFNSDSYKTEPEVLIATCHLRGEIYSDYNYNFFLDRRNDLDILDLELTKKITTQEAIYLHVKRYVESNPWYAYRYNLFDYCKENNIKIPDFELDTEGFMIDINTKQRLCPY